MQPLEVWQAKTLMVVLENEAQIRALRPDIPALIALAGCAVIVTAPGDTVDFVSRYFTLDGGEDPVTGSAHCTLMPYWTARLGRHRLQAQQVSARGGELFCELQGDRTLRRLCSCVPARKYRAVTRVYITNGNKEDFYSFIARHRSDKTVSN